MLPENWDALELFLALQTQWRHAPMGGLTGLDYSAVRATMQMHDIPVSRQRQRLDELQLLERGAINEMSTRSGQ